MKTLRVAAMATLMAIGATAATSTMAATAAELGEPLVYASIAAGGVDGSHESYKRDGSQLSIGYGLGYRFNANYSVELYSRSLSSRSSARAATSNIRTRMSASRPWAAIRWRGCSA